MISTGIQRMSTVSQIHNGYSPLLFDTLVTSWNIRSILQPITYANGYFYIKKPELSDYLITWFISIKTCENIDGFGNNFSLYEIYGNGTVTEGDFCSTSLSTNVVTGSKYMHITKVASTTNILRLYIRSCSMFNTNYLTPTNNSVGSLPSSQIANASISIVSI